MLVEGRYEGADGLFVHPVDDERVMAGNGTIGLELLEDLPELDAVVVPYGGGGLLTGIASAVKAQKPGRALLRGRARDRRARRRRRSPPATPAEVDYVRSWVDGAGSRALIPNVWAHASALLDGAFAVSLDDAAAAVRLIAERVRVIAEGAGALAAAAAVAGRAGERERRLHRLGREHRPARARRGSSPAKRPRRVPPARRACASST